MLWCCYSYSTFVKIRKRWPSVRILYFPFARKLPYCDSAVTRHSITNIRHLILDKWGCEIHSVKANQMCHLCAGHNMQNQKWCLCTMRDLSELGPPELTLAMLEANTRVSSKTLANCVILCFNGRSCKLFCIYYFALFCISLHRFMDRF